MTVLREITTEWGLAGGGFHVTVMNFSAAVAVEDQRDALQTFWTSVKALQSNVTSYGISIDGREFNDTDGGLTGTWSDSRLKQGTGGVAGQVVADATQGLIQWRTSTIINRRFLRGRTFVPGLAQSQLVSGNLSGAAVAALQAAANALIASASDLRVWHRPGPSGGGSSDAVSTANIWSELAVLRRRRN